MAVGAHQRETVADAKSATGEDPKRTEEVTEVKELKRPLGLTMLRVPRRAH